MVEPDEPAIKSGVDSDVIIVIMEEDNERSCNSCGVPCCKWPRHSRNSREIAEYHLIPQRCVFRKEYGIVRKNHVEHHFIDKQYMTISYVILAIHCVREQPFYFSMLPLPLETIFD